MNKLIFIIIPTFLLINISSLAQNQCERLKNKEISLSYIKDHQAEFLQDIENLMSCYYDTIDIQIFNVYYLSTHNI